VKGETRSARTGGAGKIAERARKEGEAMKGEIIFVVEESPEGGYEAKALGHSLFTEAESLEELKHRIQDAVRCHFEDAERPAVIRLHQVRDEVIAA
jgi:hypothetical protein